MADFFSATGIVFTLTVMMTLYVTFLARRHSSSSPILADQKLNKWLVGLSAGATANSGFVVTGAVGLGYLYGTQWVWLPIAWLLGDIVFWKLFPHRLNDLGRKVSARTLTDLISTDQNGNKSRTLALIVGLLTLICLGGYTTGQWLAGQKFLSGAFGFEPISSTILIGSIIVGYTLIGGFRGSIYADSFMAILRLIVTALCIVLIFSVAFKAGPTFKEELNSAGPNFISFFNWSSLLGFVGFFIGFAFAGFGFGLGQPQIVNRYLSGSSPKETQSAWWIYIFFVQFTWIAMTVFGVVLRGLMPGLEDPETGLSTFFSTYFGTIITGLIIADIFATISATTNSLLISMAQTLKHDVIATFRGQAKFPISLGTLMIGVSTIGLSLIANRLGGTVFDLALTSASLLGAALAPAVIYQTMQASLSTKKLLIVVVSGFTVAATWKILGYSNVINEAAPGILTGLLVGGVTLMIKNGGKL